VSFTSTLAWSKLLITPFAKAFTLKIAYNVRPSGNDTHPGAADS
jgi:hypothetical protein